MGRNIVSYKIIAYDLNLILQSNFIDAKQRNCKCYDKPVLAYSIFESS